MSSFNPSTLLSMPFVFLLNLLVILSCSPLALAASKDDWRNRSIYQVITDRFARSDGSTDAPCDPAAKKYCGGTWDGLINKLDYIQGMGFTAVWISPAVKGLEGSSVGDNYHGFWQQDIESINSHFGTPEDLKRLSDELHKRGMYLMIDILANNLAWPGPGSAVDFNKFPAPFNNKNLFHQFCYISDYNDVQNYQKCWLGNDQVSLVDIKTEMPEVRTYFQKWAANFANTYSVDGFRIDAVRHVEKEFWSEFQDANNGTFMMGEVFTQSTQEACGYAENALASVLNFPLMWAITGIYSNKEAPVGVATSTFKNTTDHCRDPTILGHFVENHDVSRFGAMTSDNAQRKNALAYAMTGDGIPVVYYGSEQGFSGNSDPLNREAMWTSGFDINHPIYQTVKAVNVARNGMIKSSKDTSFNGYWKHKTKVVYNDNDVLAVRKGFDSSLVSVTTNKGSDAPDFGPLPIGDTNFPEGAEIVDVISCTTAKAGTGGGFKVTVKKGEPQVWIPTASLGETIKQVCPKLPVNNSPAKSSTSSSSSPSSSSTIHTALMVTFACVAMAFTLL